MNKAVFLDRDGTIIKHVHYLADPDKVEIVPQGIEALTRLRDAGYLLVVVSNQSLVARGLGTTEEVEAVNARMIELLEAGGVTLDAVKYCPHRPEDNCSNRKPNPGMLREAANELDVDLSESVMIGDNVTDVEAGASAGCTRNFLIVAEPSDESVNQVGSLAEAAALILDAA